MNAPEGVYWRSEPNWAAAERISGFGVYNGTIIEVHCYQSGTAVEGSADTMWEQATDVGGRGYGSGWLNEHFINDGQPINQPSPGVPPCNAPPPPEEHPPAHEEHPPAPEEHSSSNGLVFPVFNAEGGIYYRNSPHWGDTSATSGVGVYNGDQVELICGALGDPIGPFNDTAWSYVNNLSRPVGKGWVNEHFINDGAPDKSFVSGEAMCGPSTPGMSGGGAGTGSGGPSHSSSNSGGGSTGPHSVFYSPNNTPNALGGNLEIADLNIVKDEWAPGGCDPTEGANIPTGVNTLAGWSLGRLGPVYFLAAASGTQRAEVHRIVLFDPGSTLSFTTRVPSFLQFIWPAPCDTKFNINSLLADWLSSNSANHLLVLTGLDSEEHEDGTVGRSKYAGLWKYYFAGIWNQPFASRAQICDYNDLDHEHVLSDFAWVVNHPPSTCPPAPSSQHPLTPWNP
jgi:hypothetical protein